MPICYKIENKDFKLGLWDLTESENQLFNEFIKIAPRNEIEKASKFKYPARKSEWIASRMLLYLLINQVVEIDYDTNGKPLIYKHEHDISISHTKGMIAVIVAKNLAGIDIETINERVLRIKDRFMSEKEKKQIPETQAMYPILLYWSAKETLYKIFGEKNIDFKKNLYIQPFTMDSKGEMIGEVITTKNTCSYKLHFFNYSNMDSNTTYLIVYYFG